MRKRWKIVVSAAALALAVGVAGGARAGATEREAVRCSASGLPPAAPARGLPERVARMRERIVEAARRCDYAALARLGNEVGRGLAFSYGATTTAPQLWRMLERDGPRPKPMEALVKLLALPAVRDRIGFYVWPAVHAGKTSDRRWNELKRVYSPAQVERMKRDRVYLGYRVGIRADGDWQFFIAGD